MQMALGVVAPGRVGGLPRGVVHLSRGISPGPMFARLEKNVRAGQQSLWITSVEDLRPVKAWLSTHFSVAAGWCGGGLMIWLALRFRTFEQRLLAPALGVLMLVELLWFSHGRNTQSDPPFTSQRSLRCGKWQRQIRSGLLATAACRLNWRRPLVSPTCGGMTPWIRHDGCRCCGWAQGLIRRNWIMPRCNG